MKDTFSHNQFRMLNECAHRWWAYATEQWTPPPPTDAMLAGLFVEGVAGVGDGIEDADAHRVYKKGGELKAAFSTASAAGVRLTQCPISRDLLAGDCQVEVAGAIGGLQWRGFIDVVADQHFADLKFVGQMGDAWSTAHHSRVPFYMFHVLQLSIYRELLLQDFDRAASANTGYIVGVGRTPPHAIVPVRFSDLPHPMVCLGNAWDRTHGDIPWTTVVEQIPAWRESETPPPLPACGVCHWCASQLPFIIDAEAWT